MKLIWTKKEIFRGGDLITWAYGQDCSHFALSFFDDTVFFHSAIGGVAILDNEDFYSSRTKVHEIDYQFDHQTEASILMELASKHIRKSYDYRFFCWLIWVGIKKKIFGIDYKRKIEKQDPKAFICHEVYQEVNKILDLTDKKLFEKAVMPHDLWEILK